MADGGPCRCGRGTLYDVLQVSPWCEPEVIQAAYRALARSRHPDLNRDPDAEDQMRRLNVAYQTLSDPLQRARYDEELALESAARVATPRPGAASGTAGPAHRPAASAASAPGAPPGRSRARASGAAASPSVSSAAYQAVVFDQRTEGVLSRSALYIVVILATVVLALFAYIIIDVVSAEASMSAPRNPRIQDDRTWTPGGSSGGWLLDSPDGDGRPGLSSSGERWNR